MLRPNEIRLGYFFLTTFTTNIDFSASFRMWFVLAKKQKSIKSLIITSRPTDFWLLDSVRCDFAAANAPCRWKNDEFNQAEPSSIAQFLYTACSKPILRTFVCCSLLQFLFTRLANCWRTEIIMKRRAIFSSHFARFHSSAYIFHFSRHLYSQPILCHLHILRLYVYMFDIVLFNK